MTKLAYTRAEAAEACGVSIDTIKRAIAAGQLATVSPRKTKDERLANVLIPEAELRRWLAA